MIGKIRNKNSGMYTSFYQNSTEYPELCTTCFHPIQNILVHDYGTLRQIRYKATKITSRTCEQDFLLPVNHQIILITLKKIYEGFRDCPSEFCAEHVDNVNFRSMIRAELNQVHALTPLTNSFNSSQWYWYNVCCVLVLVSCILNY